MQVDPDSKRVVFDKVMDCIPGFSAVNNLFDIFEKAVLDCGNKEAVKTDRYWAHIDKKDWWECIVYSIPIIGNIVAICMHTAGPSEEARFARLRDFVLDEKTPYNFANIQKLMGSRGWYPAIQGGLFEKLLEVLRKKKAPLTDFINLFERAPERLSENKMFLGSFFEDIKDASIGQWVEVFGRCRTMGDRPFVLGLFERLKEATPSQWLEFFRTCGVGLRDDPDFIKNFLKASSAEKNFSLNDWITFFAKCGLSWRNDRQHIEELLDRLQPGSVSDYINFFEACSENKRNDAVFVRTLVELLEKKEANADDWVRFFDKCSKGLRQTEVFYNDFFEKMKGAKPEQWLSFLRAFPDHLHLNKTFTAKFFEAFKTSNPTDAQWKRLLENLRVDERNYQVDGEVAALWLIVALDVKEKDVPAIVKRIQKEDLANIDYLPHPKTWAELVSKISNK